MVTPQYHTQSIRMVHHHPVDKDSQMALWWALLFVPSENKPTAKKGGRGKEGTHLQHRVVGSGVIQQSAGKRQNQMTAVHASRQRLRKTPTAEAAR
jgi:hypothetical protein